MGTIKFEDTVNLSDDDLLTLLKQLPNEVLLLAVLGTDEKSLTSRICQVLSFQGAIYFLEDLEAFRTLAQPKDCQVAISTIENLVNDMVTCEKINGPTSGKRLKMAS